MTVSVRLPGSLDEELEAHCRATGRTKSSVLIEAVSAWIRAAANDRNSRGERPTGKVSRNYRAFEAAGLIGSIRSAAEQGYGSATKEVVRRVVRTRVAARSLAKSRSR